ncbi:hypothetical protein GCM10010441_40310 [Kitasatospora paracochleata]
MKPRYECAPCEDWGIVVHSSGKGTVPCSTCRPADHSEHQAAQQQPTTVLAPVAEARLGGGSGE